MRSQRHLREIQGVDAKGQGGPGFIPTQDAVCDDVSGTQNVAITNEDWGANFTDADSFAFDGTLPAGLTLASETGILSGTPTEVVTVSGKVVATNVYGNQFSNTVTITIAAP